MTNYLGVGIWTTLATRGLDSINESSVVLESSLGATSWLLLLAFSFVDLWCLALDFTGTSQRTVDLTTEQSGSNFDSGAIDHAFTDKLIIIKLRSLVVQDLIFDGERL